jgi:hypothetical protein
MGKLSRDKGEVPSPNRKRSSDRAASGGMKVDVHIRLKGDGLEITRGQIIAVLAAMAAAAWAAIRFH